MTGNQTPQGHPLRAGDPRRLGRYEIVARLGEGGMGTVYLAHGPDGVPVALKVVRTDLAHDEQFRRRFRSEVNRARQVPPFCTAEVLDADPDHEQPYLVVEYVDGPSLSAVVHDRGPLSQSNLHALAIGVATALTAIHGAGVIHRDLKPNNVLLAAGSPKVIDFGIASSPHDPTGHTRTDQIVGTVAYMAPERFGTQDAAPVTPAADVFAWGAVIAYAGTGRTPFGSDSAPVVAVRILTQPPDLAGLSGPLRDLVERALSKDPNDRPTARGLLDALLHAGPARSPDLAAALARQPDLLVAAEEAHATISGEPTPVPAGTPAPAYATAGPDATTRFIQTPPAGAPAATPPPATAPPATAPATAPSGRGGRWAIALVALVAVVTSLTVAGLVYGVIALPDRKPSPRPSAGDVAVPAVSGGSSGAARVVIADPLNAEKLWHPRDDKANDAKCAFEGALVVTRQSGGSYRCLGAQDVLADFSLTVDVKLRTQGSCAAVWFRFDTSGYVLRVCADSYSLATHGTTGAAAVATLRTFPLDTPIGPGAATTVGITVRGTSLAFLRDGQPVGDATDSTFKRGRVVLGIFQESQPASPPPYSVSFSNIEVSTPTP